MIEEIQKIIAAEQEEIRRRYKAELKMKRLFALLFVFTVCGCSPPVVTVKSLHPVSFSKRDTIILWCVDCRFESALLREMVARGYKVIPIGMRNAKMPTGIPGQSRRGVEAIYDENPVYLLAINGGGVVDGLLLDLRTRRIVKSFYVITSRSLMRQDDLVDELLDKMEKGD